MPNRKAKQGQMKRLQRKLIPLNIIVSIISIVAAVTLFFSPLLEIKLGNITSHPDVIKFVDEKVNEALNSETNEAEGETSDLLADVDVPKLVVPIAESVFKQVDGNVAVSSYTLFGLATSADPGEAVSELFLSEKDGLLKQLTDSLVQAIMDLPKNKQVTDTIEDVILVSMGTQVKTNVPEEFKDFVDPQEFADTIKSMNGVKSEEEALQKIDDYLARVEAKNPDGGVMDPEKKQNVKDMMSKVYNETVEYTKDENGDNFSVEGMVCVTASETLNTEELDDIRNEDGSIDLMALVNKMMGNISSEGEGGSPSASASRNAEKFEEEVTPESPENPASPEESNPEQGGNAGSEGTPDEGNPEGGNGGNEGTPEQGGDAGNTEEGGVKVEYEVVTEYVELFGTYIKLDEDEVREEVNKLVDQYVGSYIEQAVNTINDLNASFPVFWIAFGVFAFFAGVWAILFLFSFFRLFSKNKRFTMWYVKIFGAIPVILFWLAPLVAGAVIPAYFPTLLGEFQWALPVLLSALGTMTWISGLCYIVLWALSIFWAFPVKHKIRKLIKARNN